MDQFMDDEFTWVNEAEKKVWKKIIQNLNKDELIIANGIIKDRAEVKRRMRNFIDPNFFYKLSHCYTTTVEEKATSTDIIHALQTNIHNLSKEYAKVKKAEEEREANKSNMADKSPKESLKTQPQTIENPDKTAESSSPRKKQRIIKDSDDKQHSQITSPKNKAIDPIFDPEKLTPGIISTKFVSAQKTLETVDQKTIQEANYDLLKKNYEAFTKMLSIDPKSADTYRNKVYNIKKALKRQAILEAGDDYLQKLEQSKIFKYYKCKKTTCHFPTLTMDILERHYDEVHNMKAPKMLTEVLLFFQEAEDLEAASMAVRDIELQKIQLI